MTDSLTKVLDGYERVMRRRDFAETTIEARLTVAWACLCDWGVEGFTADNIGAYLARPTMKSRWSKTTYRAHLADFTNYLLAQGLIVDDPMLAVPTFKAPRNRPRPLSESDVARVFAAASQDQADWMTLGLQAGLRAHEIAKIAGRDVSPDGLYVRGKGRVEAILPCHEDVLEIAARKATPGYWFPGVEDGHARSQYISLSVGRLFRSLEPPIEGSVHRLRHTYGTRLLRAGVNIRRVQELMRHASLETTAKYTAVDEDELRSAVSLLPSTRRGAA